MGVSEICKRGWQQWC